MLFLVEIACAFSQPCSWPVVVSVNDSVLLSTYDRAGLPVCPSRILFGRQRGQWDCVDASTPTELVEKRRKGGSEKRSNDGVEGKRRDKTLDGSPMKESLQGIVKAQSASSVGRVFFAEGQREGRAMAICIMNGSVC